MLTSSTNDTYTPGQQQTLTLTITDAQQVVICQNGSTMGNSGCPASAPLQFLEHNRAFSTNTVNISWTAPAEAAGGITIYVAANAANNNANDTGDHIYTTSLKLTPAGSGAPKPQITSGGVVSAGAFKAIDSAAPGGWIEVFGTNLASTTRGWASSDFSGSVAPTSLDGLTVTVGGRSAYVAFVSPTQVNALVPDGVPIGSGVPVVVKSGGAESDPAPLNTADVAPAILAPPPFSVGGRQYVAAIIPLPPRRRGASHHSSRRLQTISRCRWEAFRRRCSMPVSPRDSSACTR